jgi:phospholipid N-methyltransferase
MPDLGKLSIGMDVAKLSLDITEETQGHRSCPAFRVCFSALPFLSLMVHHQVKSFENGMVFIQDK